MKKSVYAQIFSREHLGKHEKQYRRLSTTRHLQDAPNKSVDFPLQETIVSVKEKLGYR